jgi:hypothetical protein
MGKGLAGRRRRAASTIALALAAAAVLSSPASAAQPQFLWQTPEDEEKGSAAGHLRQVFGIATNSSNGHVIVADLGNERIDEFDVWGQFVKAWGWGVLDGSAEPQVCTLESGCQAGIAGAGPGQIAMPNGVAVDAAGNVYVNEVVRDTDSFGEKSFRVQKFDSEGNFLLMFGGEVDKTTGANVCTQADVEGGDACGSGVPGTEDGQFGATSAFGNRIAIGPEGKVFVGDVGRIQRFSTGGIFESDVELPGETVRFMAMDGSGNFYVSFAEEANSKDDIRKLSPAGVETGKLAVEEPRALAVDSANNLYAVENPHAGIEGSDDRVVEFGPTGTEIIGPDEHFAEAPQIGGLGLGEGCDLPSQDLNLSRASSGQASLNAYGPAPDPEACPPPIRPPTIADQYAALVNPEDATVKAKVNPRFWPDATYYVEYGTGKCSEGGCLSKQPPSSESLLTSQVVNAPVTSAGVFLSGLEPGTTYHYRFVAKSSGGGPVVGLGGEVGNDGAEGAFHTFPLPAKPSGACPNDAFRTGFSAGLLDCRAYEMVSPVDKEGGDVAALGGNGLSSVEYNQAALEGNGIAYSSYRAFGDAQAAPYTSQYIATRTATGWTSHSVSPPRGANLLQAGVTIFSQYGLFSPDLCQGWLRNDTDSVLAPGGVEGFTTIYRRQNCGAEADTYTTLGPLASAPPKYREPGDFVPKLQGVSADGTHAIFRVEDRLTDNGPDLGGNASLLYESFGEGKLRLVCILPNGTVPSSGCAAGSPSGAVAKGADEAVSHAISDDGTRIFWSDLGKIGIGKLYVRVNGKNPTIQITTEPAQFWTAAADGSKAVYTIGNLRAGTAKLSEFSVETKTTTLIAEEVAGVLGASDDASRIYFVSDAALAGGAEGGSPNLYLYDKGEGGQITFIATLSKDDAKQGKLANPLYSPVDPEPRRHLARVSADGGNAVFVSNSTALSETTAGYDNTDLESGEPDAEVYRYDAQAKALACISCNPGGARPSGREVLFGEITYPTAATIRPMSFDLYAPRVMSADGSRVFFESFEALVPTDTNGREDVYEWEAPGEGTCAEGDPFFVVGAGGCLSLLSSGHSPSDSNFVDASGDGADAYISTGLSLLPEDPGLVDIYDARVEGGFPPSPPPSPPCEGEACQNPPGPPPTETPGSMTFQGAGNVHKSHAKPRCPKGRHRVHGKCVKRRHKSRGARSPHRSSGAGR